MDKIIENFETMLAKGQDNALLRLSLGNAYLKQEQFALAAQHLAKAIEFNPNYSAAWKSYGKALADNQQIEQAMTVYQQGILIAENRGDIQAAKEMKVFLRRLQKAND